MASLLETVNRLITDNGIAGGVELTSFTSVEPEISRLINAVINADHQIQGAWHDWPWMYDTASVTAVAASDVIPLPTITVASLSGTALSTTTITAAYPIKDMDHESMLALPGTSQATPIPYIEWDTFEKIWERTAKTAQAIPSAWSMKPDRSLVLSHLAPTGGLSLRYRYYMMPRKIPRHEDAVIRVPACVVDPADPSSLGLSDAVLELATMKWARAEKQFDLMAVAAEGYRIAMEDLRATYGKGQAPHLRMAAETPLEISVL